MLIHLSRESAKGVYSKPKHIIDIPDDAMPGIIVRIETAGGDLQFNSHLHCLESCGCYSPRDDEDGYYVKFIIMLSMLENIHNCRV